MQLRARRRSRASAEVAAAEEPEQAAEAEADAEPEPEAEPRTRRRTRVRRRARDRDESQPHDEAGAQEEGDAVGVAGDDSPRDDSVDGGEEAAEVIAEAVEEAAEVVAEAVEAGPEDVRGGVQGRELYGRRHTDEGSPAAAAAQADGRESRIAAGEVELLGNGSAFLRVAPPEPSDEDVYISAAQVRRCELVSGDRVSGPVRAARRSERYPSLIRVDTINGAPAEAVADGVHYDDLPAALPDERLSLGDGSDPTLHAIEWLTPLGRGSRCVISGAARAGKTETLRRLADVLSSQSHLDVSVVLAGVRPEEIAIWRDGPLRPVAALSFAAGQEAREQAVERATETARRVAARGGHAVLLIDTLDDLPPQVARRALASARNIVDGGSLTVIATASAPFGGETTVIALDVKMTSAGRLPAIDVVASGTLRPELLVGEMGAHAITQARAAVLTPPSRITP